MRKLPIIMVIAGVIVILSPLAGKLYTQYQENRMINEWLNSEDISVSPAETGDPAEAFGQLQDAFSAENSDGSDQGNASASPQPIARPDDLTIAANQTEQKVLGIIKIDRIKIKYPVIEGVKAANLRAGIGHMPGTAAIGQAGNCALAGHRNYTFGRYFNRLDEVKAGDEVVIITKTCEYRYKVYETLIVKPNDTSVIKGSKDDSILTLITCTPIYVATHRLILHARLESTIVKQP